MKLNYISRLILSAVTIITVMAASVSCSTKKNNAATRNYQAFITRYNIYYNGDTHYKETLANLEKTYSDDFTRLLPVHPSEARADESAPQPQGDFTRSIEKAQKAIQLRSIKKKPTRKPGANQSAEYKQWLRRDEYNPFLHNAWMMMGRSQFHNGDFLGAASTFFYVTKHFTWLPETVVEAKLWQARSYLALGWLYEAETILTRIKPAEIAESKLLRHLYYADMADLFIRQKDFPQAITNLKEAITTASGVQKPRLNFLLGQVYALAGQPQAAYQAFSAAGKNNSAPYELQFNARIKQSEVYQGADITPEVNALKRLTRYDRNKEFLDQIYYAIGNLYLSKADTTQAIENYKTAIEKSTRNGIDQALAQLTLGNIYYDRGRYELAQPLISSAMPRINDTYPNYEALQRRSDYLDRLAVYSQNVHLQDSLLALSLLTPEEQRAVADRLVAELKEREAREAREAKRQEQLAEAAAQGQTLDSNTQNFSLNSDKSWYFYNSATVTAGKTEFQRRWGSRKLEDDWRRRNKATFAMPGLEEEEPEDEELAEGEEDSDGEEVDADMAARIADPHFPEYYLSQIPVSDAERAVANDVIQEGIYNMGVILKDDLADFPASRHQFNTLLERYPDNVYRLDTYYNLYLMAAMQGNDALAEQWRKTIVEEFPETPYGVAMTDPDYLQNLKLMEQRQEQLYDEAYRQYLANDNRAVREAYELMKQQFPLSPIMPKFMFLDALTYVTDNKPEEFRQTLTEMLERYPDTDVAPYASAYIKGLDQGRKLNAGMSNMRGMIWDIPLSNDSTATGPDGPVTFELNPDSEQLLVLLYPTDQVNGNQLIFDVARINFNLFATSDFDLEPINFGRLGMLIIKPFPNRRWLDRYIAVLADNATVKLPRQVRPVIISQADFNHLLETGATFDDYFRFLAEHDYQRAQEQVLPEHLFGPAETLREASEADRLRQEEPSPAPPASPAESTASPAETLGNPEEAPVPDLSDLPDPSESPESPDNSETSEKPEKSDQSKIVEPTAAPAPLKPAPKPAVAPEPPKTPLPDYPLGSEGDDDPDLI